MSIVTQLGFIYIFWKIIPFETLLSEGFFYRYSGLNLCLEVAIIAVDKRTGLNEMQERFCQEFISDWNGTQAAIRAGYSEKTASVQGSQLLTLLKIKKRINELSEPITARVVESVKIDREWIVNKAAVIVESCLQMLTLKDKQGNPILDDEGKPIRQPINPKAVNASLSLIADVLALKTQTQINVNLTPQEVLAEVERRQALTTSHVETPVLTGEDTLYLPKSGSGGDSDG